MKECRARQRTCLVLQRKLEREKVVLVDLPLQGILKKINGIKALQQMGIIGQEMYQILIYIQTRCMYIVKVLVTECQEQ